MILYSLSKITHLHAVFLVTFDKNVPGTNRPTDKTSYTNYQVIKKHICVRKLATYICCVMGLIRSLNLWLGYSYFGEVKLGHSLILAILD